MTERVASRISSGGSWKGFPEQERLERPREVNVDGLGAESNHSSDMNQKQLVVSTSFYRRPADRWRNTYQQLTQSS